MRHVGTIRVENIQLPGPPSHPPHYPHRNSSNLVQMIIDVSISYLSDAGPTREAAAVCLSGILTRPDMEKGYLKNFMEYAHEVLAKRVKPKEVEVAEVRRKSEGWNEGDYGNNNNINLHYPYHNSGE